MEVVIIKLLLFFIMLKKTFTVYIDITSTKIQFFSIDNFYEM
jgi:hypothetical protein